MKFIKTIILISILTISHNACAFLPFLFGLALGNSSSDIKHVTETVVTKNYRSFGSACLIELSDRHNSSIIINPSYIVETSNTYEDECIAVGKVKKKCEIMGIDETCILFSEAQTECLKRGIKNLLRITLINDSSYIVQNTVQDIVKLTKTNCI